MTRFALVYPWEISHNLGEAMGYALDLDEYDDDRLVGEMKRRAQLRTQGLCTYCERSGTTRPCKFPERHRQAGPKPSGKTIWDHILEASEDEIPGVQASS